jgi:hypothetical protein
MQDIRETERKLFGGLAENAQPDAPPGQSSGTVGEEDRSKWVGNADDYTVEDWVDAYARWEDDRCLSVQYANGNWNARIQSRVGSLIAFTTAGTLWGCLESLEDKLNGTP